MRTVVLGPRSAELEGLIARRRALGLDTFDEVWEGDYHVAPAAHTNHGWIDQQIAELLGPLGRAAGLTGTGPFNLGDARDFRVPDRGLHRGTPSAKWLATAALVVEVESPDDESWQKLGFYGAHRVDEVVIVSYRDRAVTWMALEEGRYVVVEASRLIHSGPLQLGEAIEWPEPEPEQEAEQEPERPGC